MAAFRLVYRHPASWVLTVMAFLSMAVLLLWSSQVVTFRDGKVHVLVERNFMAAAIVIALLFALILPIQIYALRLAAASATATGGTLAGTLAGLASMTCCTPVIFPSILSLLGFSGATILSFNLTVERYWLPFATLSVILLSHSLIRACRSLDLHCDLAESPIRPANDGSRA